MTSRSYPSDVTSSGTGGYQLDNVSIVYKPANSSAKTESQDVNVQTTGQLATHPR